MTVTTSLMTRRRTTAVTYNISYWRCLAISNFLVFFCRLSAKDDVWDCRGNFLLVTCVASSMYSSTSFLSTPSRRMPQVAFPASGEANPSINDHTYAPPFF